MSNKQIYALIGVLLVWFWGMVFYAVRHYAQPTHLHYDCSVASFHPDIPMDVKRKCREVRT